VPFERDAPSVYDDQETKKLKGLILQRDNEISILSILSIQLHDESQFSGGHMMTV
jgi:hypothetical protein